MRNALGSGLRGPVWVTAQQEWTLAEDPLMARGGCRLTTDNSSVDARFEAGIAAALSGLLGDDRADRPGVPTDRPA